ncbi:TPA: hypothetical protein NGR31_000782 [Vibrio parahaemolyticus]|uniref:hypothetical protein n=1 Tax=Vibrio rotiferianus TaxID=190895 RepID=UPI0015F752B1|nr:hypothetical protein [Vibrio rotiferianus]HCE1548236.1 hypothetical protein [Vibrio parahaemolyticus]HCG5573026.1 hypothetical protein [Vibrio parahaemolyticus]HCH1025120.1 hypothetical protein [Vibrio parahaemolyticus]HCH5915833.1 hypothetical protein [Vibrio parahaemolyticus]
MSSEIKVERYLVILDPGLREFGGHHVGIISQLKDSLEFSNRGVKIDVLGSVDFPFDAQQLISSEYIKFKPHFNTDFYRFFYSDEKLGSISSYIRVLAREYFAAISSYSGTDVTFFYHTLNWEHSYALSLALSMLEVGSAALGVSNQQHLVCMMFSPVHYCVDDVRLTRQRLMRFSLGFRQLHRHENVKLFTIDYETNEAYRKLLDSKRIEFCPSGLISDKYMRKLNKSYTSPSGVVLYIGDAKDNKGFLELPSIIDIVLSSTKDDSIKFYIHYTITNDRKDLKEVHSKLTLMAEKDKRVNIISGFLSEEKMHNIWMDAKSIILNYDKYLYNNQSSGILWLAAAYDVEVHLLTNTWLNRESSRLNLKYMSHESLPDFSRYISKYGWGALKSDGQSDEYFWYRKKLTSDLADWLIEN